MADRIGHSKRFGEPLAVADGDGIRHHPAATANTKAPAAAASARVPSWPLPSTLIVANRPRAALLTTRFAALGEACVRRSSGTAGNMTSKDRRPPRLAHGGPRSPKAHPRR